MARRGGAAGAKRHAPGPRPARRAGPHPVPTCASLSDGPCAPGYISAPRSTASACRRRQYFPWREVRGVRCPNADSSVRYRVLRCRERCDSKKRAGVALRHAPGPTLSPWPFVSRFPYAPDHPWNGTWEKLSGSIYTGKRELIGFSVHNGANSGRDWVLWGKTFFRPPIVHGVIGPVQRRWRR